MKAVATKQKLPHGIDSPAVPLGYKQTDLGVIPGHWHIRQLADICMPQGIVRGPFGGTLKKDTFVTSGFKVYEQQNAIYKSSGIGSYFVDRSKYAEMHRFSVSPGDFIISCSGTIGRIFQIPPDAPQGVINQALLKLTTDDEVVYDRYFYILFEWDKFQIRIIDSTQGGAMKNLVGMDVFRTITVVLPPLSEQRAIAEALSDVDGLLNALNALIAKKRAIKQATMQQLLTGKTRLPGFSGAWEKTKISDLLVYRRPDPYIVQSAEYTEHGDVPVLTANKAFILGYTDEVSGICHNFPVIVFDDFTTDSKYATFPFKVKSSAIKLLYPKHERVSLKYAFERMQLIDFPLGNHKRYYISEYQNLELYAPDYDEQHAIASVLSDMDTEIASLEQRRDKTRAIKQGMMQQLLTGRVRLVKPKQETEVST